MSPTFNLLFFQPDILRRSIGEPLSFDELFALLGHGSDATSLDELPRTVLQHLCGYGVDAITKLPRLSRSNPSCSLLNSVLHIPLRKKEPAWLVANSRPVLLEPYLRRLEATAIFRRQQLRLELQRNIPSSMFAYRRQLNPQMAALLCRWLLCHWTTLGPVYVCDWDESNAFCNVPREACAALSDDLCPGLAKWLSLFYDPMNVHVITPFS